MASEAEIRRLIRLENQLADNRKKLAAEDDKRMKSARDIKDNIANIEQQILDIRAKQTEETQEQVSVSTSLDKLLQSRINKSEVNVLLGKKFAEQTKELVENENELIKSISEKIAGNESLSDLGEQLIEDVKALNSGELDREAIQKKIMLLKEQQNSLSEEERKSLESEIEKLQELLKARGELSGKIENQSKLQKGIDTLTGGILTKLKGFKSPIVVATAALGAAAASFQKFSAITDEVGQQFGAIGVQEFRGDLGQANALAVGLGRNLSDVAGAASELSTNFGFGFQEALGLSNQITDFSVAIGMSNQEGAKLIGVLSTLTGLSAEGAINIAKQTEKLAIQSGVAPQAVLKDIAESSESLALFSADTVDNFLEAAVNARRLGVGIDTLNKAGEKLLDFQSSLTAEFNAEVILGRDLNLNRARQLFLAKDDLGFQQEIVKQLGSQAAFQEMNRIEQKLFADALGMSTTEVAKLINNQDESLSLANKLSNISIDDFIGREAQASLTRLINSLSELSLLVTEALGPTFDSIAESILSFVEGMRDADGTLESFAQTAKNMAVGGTAGALAGSFFGPLGTVVGGTVGAGIGSVIPSFDDLGANEVANITKGNALISAGETVFRTDNFSKLEDKGDRTNQLLERVLIALENQPSKFGQAIANIA